MYLVKSSISTLKRSWHIVVSISNFMLKFDSWSLLLLWQCVPKFKFSKVLPVAWCSDNPFTPFLIWVLVLVLQTLLNHTKGKNKYCFSFDQVFTPSSSQAQVFEEISQLVQVRKSIHPLSTISMNLREPLFAVCPGWVPSGHICIWTNGIRKDVHHGRCPRSDRPEQRNDTTCRGADLCYSRDTCGDWMEGRSWFHLGDILLKCGCHLTKVWPSVILIYIQA